MTALVRFAFWVFIVGTLALSAVLYAEGEDIALTLGCEARSIESLQQEAKEWIVSRLTRSRHPYSETAIPDGTKPSEIETFGFNNELMMSGILLYTDKSGGVMYNVIFKHDCSAAYISEPCPNRKCELAAAPGVTRSKFE